MTSSEDRDLTIDEATAKLLQQIATEEAVDELDLVRLTGADALSFSEFLRVFGRENDEDAKKVLSRIRRNEAGRAEVRTKFERESHLHETKAFKSGSYSTTTQHGTAIKTSSTRPMSKTDILNALAEETGLSKKQINSVFDELSKLIANNLGKKGPGVFNVPGLMKILVKNKPATKARKGINPFTGEETMFKARPARNKVKIRPLKGLKDMV